jgi:hypothetical protein
MSEVRAEELLQLLSVVQTAKDNAVRAQANQRLETLARTPQGSVALLVGLPSCIDGHCIRSRGLLPGHCADLVSARASACFSLSLSISLSVAGS